VGLSEKNRQFREMHKDDLLATLRYAHEGKAFPIEIESAVVEFLRDRDIRDIGEKRKRSRMDGAVDNMTLKEKITSKKNRAIIEINGKEEIIFFQQVLDRNWSHLSEPIREVIYQ
jgi:hypothetical protein